MSEEPDPPAPKPVTDLHGLDPGELLARGLHTVKPTAGSGPWEPPTPEELAKLLPQYRIECLLGRGGMGAVYKGVQAALDRPVAIKLLPSELAADKDFLARFQREARTLAKLQHSGIVTVYDFGQTSEVAEGDGEDGGGASSRGCLYFVMEYVDGTDLQQILKGPGLKPEQAFELIAQICDALHYAHRQGVVHRDIKPANILLTRDGRAKVADFGLARPLNGDGGGLTVTNMVMGTPDYMAPEQRTSATHTDHRSDIFALGVMLYEMLTGQRPHGAFQPASQKVQVDVRIDEVVLKALQQEPDRRYQQASEMKNDVDRIRTTPPEKPQPPKNSIRKPLLIAAAVIISIIVAVISIPILTYLLAKGPAAPSVESSTAPAGPATATKDAPFTNSLGMKFVPMPGTEILMCIHETRCKDFSAYADAAPGVDATWKNPLVEGKLLIQGDDHPVVQVSWLDASAFCEWLSKKEGRTYRLPTEREWNLAAVFDVNDPRTISDTDLKKILGPQYPWGTRDQKDALKYGNYVEKADGYEGTAPVMSFLPNRLGIFDLGGNAWEWCAGGGDDKTTAHVLRGCGYLNHGPYRGSGTREARDPGYRAPIPPLDAFNRTWIPGFRIVLEPAPSERVAKVYEQKLSFATPTDAVLRARERGGRLRGFGTTHQGPVDLGKAAAFDDFQTVVTNESGWAARRVGGETYLRTGIGTDWGTKPQEPGPFRTSHLQHSNVPVMRMADTGSYRNVYGGQTQLRKDWAHPDSVAFLNPMHHNVVLARDGTMLFNENWDAKAAPFRRPPADFFLGATAYTAAFENYVSARPGLPVRCFNIGDGKITEFPPMPHPIVEMDASNMDVILRDSTGAVFTAKADGEGHRAAPAEVGPAIAVRRGRGVFAAQMTDGTWRAWGEAEELIEQTLKIGAAIDVDYYSAGPGKPGYMLWIEPVGTDAPQISSYAVSSAKAPASLTSRTQSTSLNGVSDPPKALGWEVPATVPSNKPATVMPSEDVLSARERGGWLRVFGASHRGPVELGKAAEFNDFQNVVIGPTGWAARRVSGLTYCFGGLGSNPNDKAVELGPYHTSFLRRQHHPVMRLSHDGSIRNIFASGSQHRPDLAHQDAVAILNPNDYNVLLAEDGRILISRHWHETTDPAPGKERTDRKPPPADFFLGATAYTAVKDHYIAARPGLPVRSFSASTGQTIDFPGHIRDIVEMDVSYYEVILRDSAGRVYVTTATGEPYRVVPPDLGPAVAVRAGIGVFAAQMTDGTWSAWSHDSSLVEQTRKIGAAIDVDYYSPGPGKPGYMLWIEPAATSQQGAPAAPKP